MPTAVSEMVSSFSTPTSVILHQIDCWHMNYHHMQYLTGRDGFEWNKLSSLYTHLPDDVSERNKKLRRNLVYHSNQQTNNKKVNMTKLWYQSKAWWVHSRHMDYTESSRKRTTSNAASPLGPRPNAKWRRKDQEFHQAGYNMVTTIMRG